MQLPSLNAWWTRPWRFTRIGLALAILGLIPALLLFVYSILELRRFERADARRTTAVYAASQLLAPGIDVRRVGLAAKLARLAYKESREAPVAPGQFRRIEDTWAIYLRPANGAPAQHVQLTVEDGRIVRITRQREELQQVWLDPELLASIVHRPGEHHQPARLGELPRSLIDAVLAAEDHRFFEHSGIDLAALARAAWRNLRAGRITQGGSTITQQLVKNRLLGAERTFLRKLTEAWLATLIEWRYSKEHILESYLNEIYLGQRGPVAIHGVGAAAQAYFGKDVQRLTASEAALLAGMIRGPNNYSPVINPGRARERRDFVLHRMHALQRISEADYQIARDEPLKIQPLPAVAQPASYFNDYVRQDLEDRFGPEVLSARGARIFTSLDLTLQGFAEGAVVRGLDRLESRHPALRRKEAAQRLQAALIAVDPRTGEILALVGGRDYATSQFNRVTLARRQAGSAFKPFVYLAALRPSEGRTAFTPATMVDDTPLTLDVDGVAWSPRNYDGRYEGRVRLRQALEQSLNAATVRLVEMVGLPAIVETARTLGLRGPLRAVPALALGATEVTPFNLTRAYVPLANGGVRPPGLFAVRHVRAGADDVPPKPREGPTQVLSAAEAYLITSLLEGVIASGTGSAARGVGGAGSVAGKTGTTNDGRDAWFLGYAPGLLAGVWVGYDSGEPHRLSGAEAALPIWAEFMNEALDAVPRGTFEVPPGVVFTKIDASNGKLATRFCPLTVREVFLESVQPPPCDEHPRIMAPVLDWWKRVKGWFQR